jgi:deaminated glutathione amidase
MRVAAVQMNSVGDKDANLQVASRLVADAAADGAELVVLPEMFNCLGAGAVLRAGAEPLDGPTSAWASAVAAEHAITLVAGTFIEQAESGQADSGPGELARGRLRNTCGVYGPDGRRTAVYRKIHLFDVDVPGAEHHESAAIEPGDEIVVVDAPPVRLGLSICYDLRFPELFRIAALQGATVTTLPAAFTATTGPPHWEPLIRARAIENQVFVIAAGQFGSADDRLHWHGHSMIVDPWGTVLAEAFAGEGVIVADLDLVEQVRVRAVLPSLANRRPETYLWPVP